MAASKPRNRRSVRPVFVDDKVHAVLVEAAARYTLLTGKVVTPSQTVRYALVNLLADEVRVLDDLGDPDRRAICDRLAEAK